MKNLLLAILLLFATQGIAQTLKIKGTATEKSNREPLIGCSVLVEGTSTGTVCDIEGEYSLTVNVGDVLKFVYVGMKSQLVKVDGSKTTINVELEDVPELIGHPIITYSKETLARRMTVTTTVNDKTDKSGGRPNSLATLIDGRWSGVYAQDNVGINREQINIRSGNTSIDGDVKYIVDDIPNAPFNAADVEKVYISKDAASASIYGATVASGGVVHVFTKDMSYARPKAQINTWMGVQKASELLPFDKKDIFDDLLRSGLVQHYNAAWSMGTSDNKLRVAGSAVYDDIEGTVSSTNLRQLSTRLKVTAKVTNWLDLGQNVFYKNAKARQGELFGNTLSADPDVFIMSSKPKETMYSSTYLEVNKSPWWNLRTLFSYEKEEDNTSYFYLNNDVWGGYYDTRQRTVTNRYMWDNYWKATHTIDYNHNLSASAHYNWMKQRYLSEPRYSKEFENSAFTTDAMLRVTYNYQEGQRTMNANIRRYSSSIIGRGHSYIYLPSVSATWGMSREYFMDTPDFFDAIRLRGGWSKTASDGMSENTRSDMLYYSAANDMNGLEWMKTSQVDAGIELRMLEYGSLMLSVNYFRKRTKNTPVVYDGNSSPLTILESTGDEVVNRGWEVDASYYFEFNNKSGMRVSGNFTAYNSTYSEDNWYANNSTQYYRPLGSYYSTPDYLYGLHVSADMHNYLKTSKSRAKQTNR